MNGIPVPVADLPTLRITVGRELCITAACELSTVKVRRGPPSAEMTNRYPSQNTDRREVLKNQAEIEILDSWYSV